MLNNRVKEKPEKEQSTWGSKLVVQGLANGSGLS